jgi:two-component system, chemotaxis family, CheB/CheR fusion protein
MRSSADVCRERRSFSKDEGMTLEPQDDRAFEAEPGLNESATHFPIVGIGASAGGLAAFEAFFSALPKDNESRMAFVLVQHLAPDHKSILSDLIRRFTPMEVFEVDDGMTVKPNCAYIIRPNCDMAFVSGTLRLQEPAAPRGQRLPIDYFFRSLAQDQHERAIGIVLSGNGSDGTLGARAIKGEGGMVMAQNLESTEHDGMPRSAIATGLVDFVLPPAEMPAHLLAFVRHSNGARRRSNATKPDDEIERVFLLLQTHTGHDFSQYKQSTIRRRIERRMAIQQIGQLSDYILRLEEAPAEVDLLFRDLLIGVTNFFRDADAFKALEDQVITRIVADKQGDAVIRVWVPGCSTGEEAYSIAMLLRDKLDAVKKRCKLQIFATDIDPRAIDVARSGAYPASVATDITPERFASYFSLLEDGNCRIHKSIRELLVFSEQDVAKDPPFSKLDLISCRNLMIYMGVALQKRLIPLFHYALVPGGTLFLGTSETVGEFGNLFSITDRKEKLYRRKEDAYGVPRPSMGNLRSTREGETRVASRKSHGARELPFRELPFRDLTERALLQDSASAALVDERGELLYLHGQTGQFLQPAPGEVGVNILRMAREGLRHDLTSALHRAVSAKEPVFRPKVRIKTNGDFTLVDVTVRPVSAGTRASGELQLYLVVFEPLLPQSPADATPGTARAASSSSSAGSDAVILELKRELQTKDEYLHATQEEMQTSNEELRSSNEELQSTNEELQSTNEELETSKEELQSVNEELATVNAELQSKVTDLSRVNNDMNNLLAGTGIGTVFIDLELCIRRFTPAITQFINLIQTDVGRPLGHTVSNLVNYDRLVEDVQGVLNTLVPTKVEVQTRAGAWFLLNIRPYRTAENVVEGAVITFTEVTALKAAQAALVVRSLAGALRDARDAITVQDLEGRILAWNPGAVRMYGWSEAEALAMNIRDLIPEAEREQALTLVRRLSRSEHLAPYRAVRLGRNGKPVAVTLTVTALVNAAGAVYALATTERGVSN